MSKASDRLAAQMARQATRAPAQPALPAARLRVKPIRITVDLPPVLHADLQDLVADAARQLGVPRVPSAAILRALLHELVDSPDLAPRVLARIPAELER